MPTPTTPDEEFDARFRRVLSDYPELPEDPAAWRGMDARLDAAAGYPALRRRVLHGFGGEMLVVVTLLGLGLWWAAPGGRPLRPASSAAEATVATGRPAVLAPAGAPWAAGPGRASASELAGPLAAPPAAGPGAAPAATSPQLSATQNGSSTPAAAAQAAAGPAAPALPGPGRPAGAPGPASARPLLALADVHRPAQPRLLRPEPGSAAAEPAATPGAEAAPAGREPAAGRRLARPQLATAPARRSAPGASPETAETAPTQRTTALAAAIIPVAGARRGAAKMGFRRATEAPGGAGAAGGPALAAGNRAPGPAPLALLDPLAPVVARVGGAAPEPLPDPLARRALPPRPAPDSLPAPRRRPAPAYRLALGLVGAPELSNVHSGPLTGPGGSLGVTLEYRLGRRWHLSTGYLQAIKRYVAAGADYHVPAGYWPANTVFSKVDANCRVVDIPLNLRYDLWQGAGAQVFVGAGLSSLLMRNEAYTYHYTTAGQYKMSMWDLRNGSNHVLQILNLSAGYERALGGRWAAQAEPFVKLPLGGVGFGAVRLSSAGVFFSLKYGLLPTRAATPPAAP